jgi:hypothetical protein
MLYLRLDEGSIKARLRRCYVCIKAVCVPARQTRCHYLKGEKAFCACIRQHTSASRKQTRCHALEREKASCAFIRQHTSAYVREGVLCLAARSTVRRVGERLLSGSADRWLSGDMWGEGVLAAQSGVRVLVPRPSRVREGRREKEFVGNTPPPAAAFLRVCVCE